MVTGVLLREEPSAPSDEAPPVPGDFPVPEVRPPASGRRSGAAGKPAGPASSAAWKERSRELAVFDGRGPVPVSAVEALWAAQGMGSEETARLLGELVDRSVVRRDEAGRLLFGEPASAPGAAPGAGAAGGRSLAAAHGRLVDGYRSLCPDGSWWRGPDDGYFFANIAYHMVRANRAQDLRRLLLDYDWLSRQLRSSGIAGLLADFANEPLPDDVEAVEAAIELSAAGLAVRPDRLASHLADRLVGYSSPAIDRLLEPVRERGPRPWICPLPPARTSPAAPLLRALPNHAGPVRTLAVNPDGRELVSGGDDHTIRIWDVASGRLERTLVGHTDSVQSLAVTPDGRRIVSGGTYDVVRVWDLATGQFVHALAGDSGCRAVHAVAIAPDGGRVVWGGAGSTLRVWDLTRARLERTLASQDPKVRTVAVTPDGRLALSGGDAGLIHVWDLASGRLVRILKGCAAPVFALAVTPDGCRAVSNGHDNTVQIWNIGSGRLERTLWGHTGAVVAIAITPDGRRIFSGGQDCRVRCWDLADGRELAVWNAGSDATITTLCSLSGGPGRAACGDSAGAVRIVGLLEA